MGGETIEVEQFNIRVVARTLPGKQFEVGRALRARIAAALTTLGLAPGATYDATESSAAE